MSSELSRKPNEVDDSKRTFFHYLRRRNASERASMLVATLTFTALAVPFFVGFTSIDWELATVDGKKIGAWRWVDTGGK
jgi:hypothetical protein